MQSDQNHAKVLRGVVAGTPYTAMDVFGPTVEFISGPDDPGADICAAKCPNTVHGSSCASILGANRAAPTYFGVRIERGNSEFKWSGSQNESRRRGHRGQVTGLHQRGCRVDIAASQMAAR